MRQNSILFGENWFSFLLIKIRTSSFHWTCWVPWRGWVPSGGDRPAAQPCAVRCCAVCTSKQVVMEISIRSRSGKERTNGSRTCFPHVNEKVMRATTSTASSSSSCPFLIFALQGNRSTEHLVVAVTVAWCMSPLVMKFVQSYHVDLQCHCQDEPQTTSAIVVKTTTSAVNIALHALLWAAIRMPMVVAFNARR